MYVIHKSPSDITEELVVKGKPGEADLVLPVHLKVDDVLVSYNRLRQLLREAQEKLQEAPGSDEQRTAYGRVIVEFFALIFGQDGARRLLEFYADHYDEMLVDVAPFIVECIQPQMEAAMAARVERYKSLSQQANRAQRRTKRWFK